MNEQAVVFVEKEELHRLIKNKVMKAGLPEDHADEVANHLSYADSRGVHSHGAVRVEYYSERIAKGGSNAKPNFSFRKTGPCTGVYEGDNAVGMVVARNGMVEAIKMAKENGIGFVGMRKLGHCGTLSYFLRMATDENLIAMSMCQSDPMVVPYGSAEPYFGTNPIGFAAPCAGRPPIVFDMATTVGAWGKILDARAKNKQIPPTWAVDSAGRPTTDPFAVGGLLAIAGPKGYGLMMMVDILCGSMLGVPFGKHVSSMYADLSAGRDLGQIHLVINPEFFGEWTPLPVILAGWLRKSTSYARQRDAARFSSQASPRRRWPRGMRAMEFRSSRKSMITWSAMTSTMTDMTGRVLSLRILRTRHCA